MEHNLVVRAKSIDQGVLGSRLREARLGAGLRQADVAGSHCSAAYLSRIESGDRRPDPRLLEHLADALGVSVQSLLRDPAVDDGLALRLELDYAELYLATGEPEEALRRAETILERLPETQHAAFRCAARRLLGSAQEAIGRTEAAIDTFAALAEEPVDDVTWLQVTIALCRCYRELGDLSRAISVGESGIRRATELGLQRSTEGIQIALTLAAAHYENGDITDAVRMCQRAIQQAESGGSSSARASAYWNASVIESHRGDVEAAIVLAKKALALFEGEGEARHLARLRSQLGIFQLRLEPPDTTSAEANLQQAQLELATSHATPADVARNNLALARAHMLTGSLRDAEMEANKVFVATHDDYPLIAAEARILAGSVSALDGNVEEALDAAREGVLLLSSMSADRAIGQLWFDLADIFEGLGAHEESRDAYRRAAVSLGLWRRLGGAPAPVAAP